MEEGGFLYDSDSYADDLPYWTTEYGRPHLIIPYTLSENDMKFAIPNGFANADDFSKHLIHTLDYLVKKDGGADWPALPIGGTAWTSQGVGRLS